MNKSNLMEELRGKFEPSRNRPISPEIPLRHRGVTVASGTASRVAPSRPPRPYPPPTNTFAAEPQDNRTRLVNSASTGSLVDSGNQIEESYSSVDPLKEAEQKMEKMRQKYKRARDEMNFKAIMIDSLETSLQEMQALNKTLLEQRERDKEIIVKKSEKLKERKKELQELKQRLAKYETSSKYETNSYKSEPTAKEKPTNVPAASNPSSMPISKVVLNVSTADDTFVLRTVTNANWTVGQIISSIRKKMPGNNEGFELFYKNKKDSYVLLDKELPLTSHKIDSDNIELEFNDPMKYKGKDNRHLKRTEDATPQNLRDALRIQNVAAVKKYLTVEEIGKLEKEGTPPLHEALTSTHHSLFDALLDFYKKNHLTINAKDKNGWTALHCAVSYCTQNDQDEMVLKRLLKMPGIIVDLENEDQNTPLHYFVQKFLSPSCQEVGELLINKAPGAVNMRNKNGETPLHKAIFNPSVRVLMVQLLVNNRADANVPNLIGGETALHYAVRLGRKNIVKMLLHAGANIELREFRENRTALELAQHSGEEEIASILKEAFDLNVWLKEHGLGEWYPSLLKEDLFLKDLANTSEKLLDSTLQLAGVDAFGARLKMANAIVKLRDKNLKKEFHAKLLKVSNRKTFEPTAEQRAKLNAIKEGMTGETLWLLKHSELEFTKELGSGAYGKVFKGLYRNEKVAIKVLKISEESLEEFKKEFTMMSVVQSPYIVHFFGACLEPKTCMVMEYCSRGSLFSVLKNPRIELSWPMAVGFISDMAEGMDSLHSWKPDPVFHRDMKTLNLLVCQDWTVKVSDMGLARFNNTENAESMARICGTYSYLSPEVFSGETFIAESDVYSMGIVMWEIVNRIAKGHYEVPFSEYPEIQQDFMIPVKVAEQQLRPTIADKCPLPLSTLIQKCWAQNPEDRPTTREILQTIGSLKNEFAEDEENV